MPSPFPGMDPFIEGQRWQDFHTRFITVLGEMLMPQVRPRYVVEVEEYVYLAREGEASDRLIEPDVAVVEGRPEARQPARGIQARRQRPLRRWFTRCPFRDGVARRS